MHDTNTHTNPYMEIHELTVYGPAFWFMCNEHLPVIYYHFGDAISFTFVQLVQFFRWNRNYIISRITSVNYVL